MTLEQGVLIVARNPNAQLLDSGDLFPKLQLTSTSGAALELPRDFKQTYNVVLVNRGAWCPYCVAQLRGFQSGLAKLAEAGVGVVSLSAEPLAAAQAMVKEHGLEFPVAYGASLELISSTLGVYYEPKPEHVAPHFHSSGFVLGPGNRVLTAVYSSGAIGRLVWSDVLGLIQYLKSHA
ncbi:MAG TPA: redoxin domain-containing protein [Polyangiaceae bacterium]